MEDRTVRIHVTGRVQGVAFRAFTHHQGNRLQLGGYVKNLADGSVEAVAHGPAPAVETFLELMRRGPHAARVDRVTVDETELTGLPGGFEIRY